MRNWLKNIRKSKGYSTYKAADLSGISQSYYFAIESGERGNPLNVDIAKKIARALDFPWTKFYEELNEKEAKR